MKIQSRSFIRAALPATAIVLMTTMCHAAHNREYKYQKGMRFPLKRENFRRAVVAEIFMTPKPKDGSFQYTVKFDNTDNILEETPERKQRGESIQRFLADTSSSYIKTHQIARTKTGIATLMEHEITPWAQHDFVAFNRRFPGLVIPQTYLGDLISRVVEFDNKEAYWKVRVRSRNIQAERPLAKYELKYNYDDCVRVRERDLKLAPDDFIKRLNSMSEPGSINFTSAKDIGCEIRWQCPHCSILHRHFREECTCLPDHKEQISRECGIRYWGCLCFKFNKLEHGPNKCRSCKNPGPTVS